ncbi:bacteriochlorophyll 4-vinyl reductase [Palleronia sp. KMU-117]|uniref:bacteriochlorophyll 4-vinyl reductase n=1 Tax=Palleronia sp. KMU-117 TaxID=3434108 RepID=UPI003D71ECC4
MPDGADHAGLIGPNALTQLLPLLERAGGARLRDRLLAEAGIFVLPDMTGLVDEAPVARLHQAMRAQIPDLAPALAWEAGVRTADYIIANRIPGPVVVLLRGLPVPLAAPLLVRAIAQHAWTFAGSGRFEVLSRRPLRVAIHDNPVVRGEIASHRLCHWHAAVFERLFTSLVHGGWRAREVECCAMGHPACVFEIGP